MIKKKEIINILLALIMFITFNFVFVLDGCSSSNNSQPVETVVGQNPGIDSNEDKESLTSSLEDIYQLILGSGRPSIIVFSYDADCCPGTKAFFEEYNSLAMELIKVYTDEFDTLFINIGILDENDMSTLIEIATRHEVLNLPSILILDKADRTYKVIEGFFDETEVKKVLDGMLDD